MGVKWASRVLAIGLKYWILGIRDCGFMVKWALVLVLG